MSAQNPLAEDLDHILDHTRDLWEDLHGERIFITGGSGFFGCWLLESFIWANECLNLGSQATVLTRDPLAFQKKAPHLANHPSVHLLQGDVRDFAFPDGSFPFVIHAATESSARLNSEKPLVMLDTIVQGTRRALEFAAEHKTRKLLFTSSGAVYGKQSLNMTHIPEDYVGAPDPMDPGSAYGIGKRTAEHLCALFAHQYGFEAKIARCFAFVGPYLPLDAHFAIGNFIRDGLHGGPVIVQGNGTPFRSYLYAADLAIWLWTILLRGLPSRPYNVGSSEGISISDLASLTAQLFDPEPDVEIREIPDPKIPAERYVPDVVRAEAELSLRSSIPLKNGIERTINFIREERNESW